MGEEDQAVGHVLLLLRADVLKLRRCARRRRRKIVAVAIAVVVVFAAVYGGGIRIDDGGGGGGKRDRRLRPLALGALALHNDGVIFGGGGGGYGIDFLLSYGFHG